ncbi:EAL domain-containing protein [Klebsiella sp. MISC125]|uniref:EAL domain-containing protein n=1 Tax=Klebsiella sp. MISC125 TaxID=2755386 RepID=UPI003DA9DED2
MIIDFGNIILNYQAIYSVKGGSIAGIEVLIRYRSETKSISTDELIKQAIKANKINELTVFVIKKSLQEIHNTILEYNLFLSLNFHPINLEEPSIIATLIDEATKYHIPFNYIMIEITEHKIVFLELVKSLCNEILNKGFRLAMDDYGCGYSNEERAYSLPFSEIKIDKTITRSFINNHNPNLEIFLEKISKNGVNIVFEGVETEGDYICIKKSYPHCYVQGWYLSHPIDKEEFYYSVNQINHNRNHKTFALDSS